MDEVRLGKKITSHLQILLGNLCTALGLEKKLVETTVSQRPRSLRQQ